MKLPKLVHSVLAKDVLKLSVADAISVTKQKCSNWNRWGKDDHKGVSMELPELCTICRAFTSLILDRQFYR